jgi:nucleoside-diphosphate-sugar epimerase
MPSNSMTNTAVVVGATGIVGRAIAAKLAALGGWRVFGATRSGGTVLGLDQGIAVDLLDAAEARRRLEAARGATHLFFAGYAPQRGFPQEVGPNLALLVNAVEGLEAAGAPLRHVTLVTGAKYYGVHLGRSAAPAAEHEPRHLGPNYYYAQEDYLRSRSDAAWRWTHLIPTHVTGFALGNPMNLALSIAVYASLVREAGLRLDFPGPAAAFGAMTQVVDAEQLAEAAAWSATTPQAAGEVFNVANGDPTRWSRLWPAFADYFGVPAGGPRPIPLSSFMPELAPLWRSLAARHGLVQPELGPLVNWGFLEFLFAIEYDIVAAQITGFRQGRSCDANSQFAGTGLVLAVAGPGRIGVGLPFSPRVPPSPSACDHPGPLWLRRDRSSRTRRAPAQGIRKPHPTRPGVRAVLRGDRHSRSLQPELGGTWTSGRLWAGAWF